MDGAPTGRAREVFLAFLKLGLTSFGGPIAHLGYFRQELVVRRRWLDEAGYADLVALCQFLPGPASSQVGFALGLLRAGALGALAAWTAFTLPSALALLLFAFAAGSLEGPLGGGLLHGLKVVAVAVVAQAVWGMARALCPDRARAAIAVAAALVALFVAGASGQVAAILLGALAGLLLCRGVAAAAGDRLRVPLSRGAGLVALALFFLLLAGLPLAAAALALPALDLFDALYRSGALVFGGGHVVLPLLEAELVHGGGLGRDAFLAGYGAAQAVPGPLFSIAAYLGALVAPGAPGGGSPMAGAALGLVALFLPGLLLVVGTLPFWHALRRHSAARAALAGTNAAVVGLLGAALWDPLWRGTILGPADFALALVAFVLLTVFKAPPWLVVALTAAGGLLLGLALA